MSATDLTLATTLKPPPGYVPRFMVSGEAILAGQAIYQNPTDTLVYKALATSVNASKCIGFALASAPGTNQPVPYINEGEISNVGTVVVGEAYFVSETTAGAIMKYSDIGAGEYVSFVGIGKTASIFSIHLFAIGIPHA